MADDQRFQPLQHIQLAIEVVLEQQLVCAAGNVSCLVVHGCVVVDGDGVDVVHRADEELKRHARYRGFDQLQRRLRPDPVDLKSDHDFDLRGIFLTEP